MGNRLLSISVLYAWVFNPKVELLIAFPSQELLGYNYYIQVKKQWYQ